MFGKTLRNDPAEAELVSHRLMLRAGMIYQVSAGVYSYMPLALRSLQKIEQIIREEMDAAGGQEVYMSALQPLEFWDTSGRSEAMGSELFRLHDRRERPLVLAPTHEELLTYMVKANVNSYRDLPLIIYQIQTKFRDEPRPRGGLIRVREFDMKDAYSFDIDEAGLDVSYDAMAQAYRNIFSRCGLETIEVEADSGAIGGKDSSEFILVADAGEDTVVICPTGDYAANAEKAVFAKPRRDVEPLLPIEEAHTPGIKTIEELCDFLEERPSKTLKAVFYMASGELVFVVIRGDLEVNEIKLSNVLGGVPDLRLASPGGGPGAWTYGWLCFTHRTRWHKSCRRRIHRHGLQLPRRREQARLPPAKHEPPSRLRGRHRYRHRARPARRRLRKVRDQVGNAPRNRSRAHLQARHQIQRRP